MARGRPHRSRRAAVLGVAWGATLLVVSLAAPRLVAGYGGLQTTRFHAGRVSGPHPGEHARKAAHAAARVVDQVAPLPWARAAARLALDAAATLEARNRPSAIAAYGELGAALDRATSSSVRGIGLDALADEVRARREETRAATPGAHP